MTRYFLCPSSLFLLFLSLVLWAPSWSYAQSAEAERQLNFAREELQAGHYEQAIKSAESALRLEPSLYDALFVKALAEEGLGNYDVAKALLITYSELHAGMDLNPEVLAAIRRIQQKQGGTDSKRKPASQPTGPAKLEPVKAQTEADFHQALSDKRCAEAIRIAKSLIDNKPDHDRNHRLLGDAQLCAKRYYAAVAAYDRAIDLGNQDADISFLLPSLKEKLPSLAVDLRQTARMPKLRLLLPNDELVPDVSGDRIARFRYLPADTELRLQVSGRDIVPETHSLDPLAAAEHRQIEIEVKLQTPAPPTVAKAPTSPTPAPSAKPKPVEKTKPQEEVETKPQEEIVTQPDLAAVTKPAQPPPATRPASKPTNNKSKNRTLVPAIAAIGSAAASGLFWALAASADSQADGFRDDAINDPSRRDELKTDYDSARSREKAFVGAGIVTAAGAAAGAAVTISFGAKDRRQAAR